MGGLVTRLFRSVAVPGEARLRSQAARRAERVTVIRVHGSTTKLSNHCLVFASAMRKADALLTRLVNDPEMPDIVMYARLPRSNGLTRSRVYLLETTPHLLCSVDIFTTSRPMYVQVLLIVPVFLRETSSSERRCGQLFKLPEAALV